MVARPGLINAIKAIPGRNSFSSTGGVRPVAAEAYVRNSYANAYSSAFLPRSPHTFTSGAFAPMAPIQPTPLDTPPPGGRFPDPRLWQYQVGWNLPTPPGSEGIKLASFDQLRILSQKYCLNPMTRVLCSDLNWRPLTEIAVDDKLVAFDENPPGPGQHRKMRIATVTDYDRIIRPSYRVRFTDGREVIASAEHLWLSGSRGGNVREFSARNCDVCGRDFVKAHALGAHRKRAHNIDGWWKQQDNGAWIATDQLRPGSKVKDLGQPWQRDDSWESGYLSGVFDGEASLTIHSGPRKCWEITFSQKPGAVFDATGRFLKEKGYNTRVHGPDQSGCMHLTISGIRDCFRFLGEMQPYRLLGNSAKWLDGNSPSRSGCAVVESVEFLGEQEVIAIGTSTSTLIAEGLFSHNSVARACIELRLEEIRGLEWEVALTTDAAKAYQGSKALMRDFGERKVQAEKFFNRPDPDFWTFDAFLNALLEEIFVYDALSIIFQPKFGERLGMHGKGLLGSKLDCLQLVSGPTIRPLIGLHGEHPAPPDPAYQQYLYGVPRSDYVTLARGDDIDDFGLGGSEVNAWDKDVMLYAPYWATRETPYGFPPVERALIPIISGLQKQEFQLDYFTEGTVPAVYISPGDNNMTPTQIKELQDALNGIAGDPAYHLKVLVLPPGSKVEPQRPVDLSDSFDQLIMNQVCMAFDVQPIELGILPNIGGGGGQGPSASAVRFAAQEARDVKSRTSTKPLLKFICSIFNYVLQDICQQPDLQFQFEGLVDDEDKQAITQLGVEQIQNGVSSIDEIRERLDLPPWGLKETSEPIVMTQQGPIPFSMAPQLIQAALQNQNSSSSSSSSGKKKGKQPSARRGSGGNKPNGSHPAPVAPSRANPSTPAHAAAAGAVQRPQRGKTGGTPSRSPVAGSRKRGEARTPTQGRQRNDGTMPSQGRRKAVASELDALRRHVIKGRDASTWEPLHIPADIPGVVAAAVASGMTPGDAVTKANVIIEGRETYEKLSKSGQWPGWQQDLTLVKEYSEQISDAFRHASEEGEKLRRQVARKEIWVTSKLLHDMINDSARDIFLQALTPLWTKAWTLGYESASQLIGKGVLNREAMQDFLNTEGQYWLDEIALTGLGNSNARSEIIARTEVARAVNAAALQCYKDNGIAYKQLLIAPDDACKICKKAAKDGVVPLDALFSSGGVSGPCHPMCRCIPGPAGIAVEPPLARKSEDTSRVAWLLIRARDEDGKWRYLLQQRDNGSWGMPGGTTHTGEKGWDAAYRETTEEIGDLPPLKMVAELNHVDPDGVQVYLYLCESSFFEPKLNGSTPEETAGTGWFRRGEVHELDLISKFRDDWDHIIAEALDALKSSKRLSVDESGNVTEADDEPQRFLPGGSRWPVPHRADGAEEPEEVPGSWGQHGPPGMWPSPAPGSPGPGAKDDFDGMIRGVPPGKAAEPVVGTAAASTPKPVTPVPSSPETFNPEDAVEHYDPAQGSNVAVSLPRNKGAAEDAALADPEKPGGPSDYSDPSPVNAEHVMNLMRSNFPEDAIQWVMRARWIGPVNLSWNRIDIDDIDKWAASHQPEAVNRFARDIKAGKGHTNPSILIQDNDSPKAIIIDGHHRALAHHKLGQPVLAYLGQIDPKDRMAAEETHSKQVHSGQDPENK